MLHVISMIYFIFVFAVHQEAGGLEAQRDYVNHWGALGAPDADAIRVQSALVDIAGTMPRCPARLICLFSAGVDLGLDLHRPKP